jgi:hypothetical protein
VSDLHEPFANGERPLLAVLRYENLARHELCDEPGVLWVHADLPFNGRKRHHVDVFGERHFLRSHDFKS